MKTKILASTSEAFDAHQRFDDRAHGFIQFKGTDICMDCYCECGYHFHVDGYFAGAVKCPACSTIYAPNCFVEFIAVRSSGQEPLEDTEEVDKNSYWKDESDAPS